MFDVTGRRVATLAEGDFAAGEHQAAWAAPGGAGSPRAGVYFAHMVAGRQQFTRRLVLVR